MYWRRSSLVRWKQDDCHHGGALPTRLSVVWKHLLADVGAMAAKAAVLIEDGDPVETILRTAEIEQCRLDRYRRGTRTSRSDASPWDGP